MYVVTKRNHLSETRNSLYKHRRKESKHNIELNSEPRVRNRSEYSSTLNEVLHLVFSTSNIIIHRILFPCQASYWGKVQNQSFEELVLATPFFPPYFWHHNCRANHEKWNSWHFTKYIILCGNYTSISLTSQYTGKIDPWTTSNGV